MITTADTTRYTGATVDQSTGTIAMGPRIETDRPAQWQLYTPGSMRSGAVVGAAGSGKSNLLSLLAHAAMSSGTTVVWYADPQGGVSSPGLAAAADRTARSIGAIHDMVQALGRIVNTRCAYHQKHRLSGFAPSRERPGLLVVIDQFSRVAADRGIRTMLEDDLVSLGQKVGVAFAVGTDNIDRDVLGGSWIHNYFVHNLVLLRHNRRPRLAGISADLDPSRLPAAPGHAYHVHPDPNLASTPRAVAFRAAHLGNADQVRRWFNQIPARGRARLDRDSAAAARVDQ